MVQGKDLETRMLLHCLLHESQSESVVRKHAPRYRCPGIHNDQSAGCCSANSVSCRELRVVKILLYRA